MPAAPFGGHPTFGQYLAWAQSEGCEIKSGIAYNRKKRAHSVTIIVAPSGRRVVEIGVQVGDFLTPTGLSRLDRRLGIKSPYFSLPGDD